MKDTSGITLIALIITIIILLILAGVTISAFMGNNGLINRAKDAKIATEIASIKEEIQTEILGKQAENQGNISSDNLEKILLTYGKLSGEEKLIDKTLTTTKGNYKIKVADIFNGTTVKDVHKNPICHKTTQTFPISGNTMTVDLGYIPSFIFITATSANSGNTHCWFSKDMCLSFYTASNNGVMTSSSSWKKTERESELKFTTTMPTSWLGVNFEIYAIK